MLMRIDEAAQFLQLGGLWKYQRYYHLIYCCFRSFSVFFWLIFMLLLNFFLGLSLLTSNFFMLNKGAWLVTFSSLLLFLLDKREPGITADEDVNVKNGVARPRSFAISVCFLELFDLLVAVFVISFYFIPRSVSFLLLFTAAVRLLFPCELFHCTLLRNTRHIPRSTLTPKVCWQTSHQLSRRQSHSSIFFALSFRLYRLWFVSIGTFTSSHHRVFWRYFHYSVWCI